ncbi:MAG: DUF1772 domain-containing protein [Marinosulfonomonas sp.]|nr:DUF1772 domain-containing protein [Marinosulfonomonas sp.]
MSLDLLIYVFGIAALLSGIIAGVFLAFSDFVMASLTLAKPAVGIEAMQIINRRVYRSLFLVLLLGMVPVSVGIAIYAHFELSGLPAFWFVLGGLIYVIGVFGVTMVCNVPMNKKLDALDVSMPATKAYWAEHTMCWTRWNHLRTFASVGAAVCFLCGCVALATA